jgi:hypothetical protein
MSLLANEKSFLAVCVDQVVEYILEMAKTDSIPLDTAFKTLNVVVFEIGHYLEKVGFSPLSNSLYTNACITAY